MFQNINKINQKFKTTCILQQNNLINHPSPLCQRMTNRSYLSCDQEIDKYYLQYYTNGQKLKSSHRQVIFINNKDFLTSKSPNHNQHQKVIYLNNKSKSKQIHSQDIKKQQTIPTKLQNEQHKYRFSSIQQCLLNKIQMLESHIRELHTQKQYAQIKLSQQNQKYQKQFVIKVQRISQLQHKLALLCQRYQQKQLQIEELIKILQNQRKQKQRLLKQLKQNQLISKQLISQNLINLTISKQIENISKQNKYLKNKQQYIKQNENINIPEVNTISSICKSKNYTNMTNTINTTLDRQNTTDCLVQRIIQESQQIIEIDSQIFHIEQIITKINQITEKNVKLKEQLQQCRNQLQIKETLAQQTARIVQSIQNQVHSVYVNDQCEVGGDKISQCELKMCIKNIREILSQICQN